MRAARDSSDQVEALARNFEATNEDVIAAVEATSEAHWPASK